MHGYPNISRLLKGNNKNTVHAARIRRCKYFCFHYDRERLRAEMSHFHLSLGIDRTSRFERSSSARLVVGACHTNVRIKIQL